MSDLDVPLRPKRKKTLVDFFVQFRWVVVIFVVLRISCTIYVLIYLGDLKSEWKSYDRRKKEHDENVKKAVKRLNERNPSKDGLVCTARMPWTVVGMRNVDYKRARHFEVDLSAFRNIIEIDKKRMIARVEPLVNMGQIIKATVPMNLAFAVVAELDDLTVGGLNNGFGIQGSSHIYGLFADTIMSYEIGLADGRVVRATKDNEYSDLYYAIPWSQGMLGLLVSAEIKLIPIKEYMRLTNKLLKGKLRHIAQAYMDAFAPRDGDQDNPEKVPDFVETMLYNPTEAVCMTGRYASKEEAKKKGNVINNCGRFLLGWMMPPNISLLKATQGEAIRNYYHENHVIQDMLVPLYKVGDALEWVHREMEVYPLWVCPHRLFRLPLKTMIYPEPGFEQHKRQGDTHYAQMYTDVGVYYAPGPILRGEVFDGAEAVRKLEKWLIENHGFQPQYAVSELNEKDFWRMFDGSLYEKARRKYKAVGTFMSVYYKSKKGRKTEKEVAEAEKEVAELETPEVEGT
ncbi:hypothetical protein Cgig2_013599 [Carnegiea gigantea]|uniref:Delta(24)-sterol reductase n=1 Tax=Carnegiea gigantea TaxID=171969 RepID=A0A9Q1GTK0_9CARY|nr:hypothetical protein Cgig2_013599 [Carnegiea gigantea]